MATIPRIHRTALLIDDAIDGDVPIWSDELSRWVPGPQTGGGGAAWGGITGTLGDQTDLQTALAGKAASAHAHAPADVTGTAVVTADARLSDARTPLAHSHPQSEVTSLVADLALKAPLASPAFTGTPTGITKTHVGLANVDNTTDAGKPVSTAQQTALDGKSATGHTHAGVYEPANANIQTHVGSAHAPSNAQKNSDITKAEIEAVLIGVIATHSHAGGGSMPDVVQQKRAPTAGTTITAGYSAYISSRFEVLAGLTLEIGAEAVFEIGG